MMKKSLIMAVIVMMLIQLFAVRISEANSGNYDLLIITPQEFQDELLPLKQFKDATLRPALIVTLEDIYSNYSGADEAEKVKKCIADYKENHSIKYVLLVGDVDKLPMRYFYLKRYNSTHINWLQYYLTDHYYADLYDSNGSFCSWDANGNGIFGEIIDDDDDGDFDNIDGMNYEFDVSVGRIPASNAEEVRTYVDKVIRYETGVSFNDTWFKNILLVTGTGDWVYPSLPTTYDEEQNDDINTNMSSIGFTSHKMYHSLADDDPHYPNSTNINTHLNDGAGFMNVISHGNNVSWGVYNVQTDMDGLTNVDKLTVIYSFGCSTAKLGPICPINRYIDVNGTVRDYGGEYTYPIPIGSWVEPAEPNVIQGSATDISCMPEYWDLYYENGAIAFVGSTAESSGVMGSPVMQKFFQSFAEGHRILGDLWKSLNDKIINGSYDIGSDWDRTRRYLYINVFGDPSLVIGGLDDKPPVTSLSIGSPKYISDGNTYVKSSTIFTLTPTDDIGIANTYYRYYPASSSSDWSTGISFLISGNDGEYIIEYYSVDTAGNTEYPIKSETVILDNTPPEITKEFEGPKYSDHITSQTTIWVNSTDDGLCPIGSVHLNVKVYNATGEIPQLIYDLWDNVTSGTASINFTISEECEHWINITAIDDLGNTAWHNQTVYVDNSSPNATVDEIVPYCQIVNETNPITITVTAEDLPGCAVGVANVTLYYRFSRYNSSFSPWIELETLENNEPWQWEFTASNGSGYYQFYAVAYDLLGNQEPLPNASTLPEAILCVKYVHTYTLYPKWNMLTIPVKNESITNAKELGNFLNSQGCNVTVIVRFNASIQRYESWVAEIPDKNNFEIVSGMGYWIFTKLTEQKNFSIEGRLIEEINVSLYVGYNLIGWANIENTNASTLGSNISNCTKVGRWRAWNQTWAPEHIVGYPPFNFNISIGDAVFIFRKEGGVIAWDGGRSFLPPPY
ncbi:MAG: hypothetical protein H5T44_00590 [Thermoplasmatales archaeon]|nr:hypothetical protein [Thermoplasmatales archaeon]